MQTVQLKLENIRSIFENQQAGFRSPTDKNVRPIQFVVPASEDLIRSRAPCFSPNHGKISYIHLFQPIVSLDNIDLIIPYVNTEFCL